jgi:isoleucyl-tRNA synthetase
MADQPSARDYRETLFLPETDFPMRAGLPQKEPEWIKRWDDEKLYDRLRAKAKGRPTYVLHDGPPYANGAIHIGHAENKILKDFMVRTRQMLGFDADYIPGWDCHGLPIEWKVEEDFRKQGKKKQDIDPVTFRKACRDYAAKWLPQQLTEFRRLGIEGDWEGHYTTMSFAAEAAIAAEFLKVVRTGLVYRGSKPVMWSPVERTSLAEAEVEYAEKTSTTIWVKFPIVEGGDPSASVVIWTTTPWTIPGNRAISFAPSISYGVYEVQTLEQGLAFEPWVAPGDKLALADKLAEDVMKAAKAATWLRLGDFDPAGVVCAHPLNPIDNLVLTGNGDGWAGGAVFPMWSPDRDMASAGDVHFRSMFRDLNEASKSGSEEPGGGAGGGSGIFPAYSFEVPLLAGDHVTDDAGTGFVHTAPGHGADDFAIWVKNFGQSGIPFTVDADGRFTAEAPGFEGLEVIQLDGKSQGKDGPANKAVIDALIASGNLLARGTLKHQYPHSWRSHAPLIFRNTPQFFIALDRPYLDAKTLRQVALAEIERVDWGQKRINDDRDQNRMRGMIVDRPDWLISRQRNWGVPLCIFIHKATGEILQDEAVDARIIAAMEQGGADVWWSTPAQDFLGPSHKVEDYEKVEDILDVWFDSGCTHSFVLAKRDSAPWPADLYLEGTDQHRGWFQSSLLQSCATRGRAPYDAVVTYGFTVDEQGRKMSKSLGNGVEPQDLQKQYGIEIFRLVVAAADYRDELRIGKTIIDQSSETYRKLRNTIRYLLGSLSGFDDSEALPIEKGPLLERWLHHRLWQLDGEVRTAYETFQMRHALSAIVEFCNVDLSAFYVDVRKDALYCDRPDAERRRACRTALDAVFNRLVTWLAPLMPFTADEAWRVRFPDGESVHLETFPQTPAAWRDEASAEKIARLRGVRAAVTGALEIERREKRIGASLEAAPEVFIADAALRAEVESVDFAELCITSGVTVVAGPPPAGAFALDGIGVVPTLASGKKCARSWRFTQDVGADPRYPELSARDADAVAWWDAQHAR